MIKCFRACGGKLRFSIKAEVQYMILMVAKCAFIECKCTYNLVAVWSKVYCAKTSVPASGIITFVLTRATLARWL